MILKGFCPSLVFWLVICAQPVWAGGKPDKTSPLIPQTNPALRHYLPFAFVEAYSLTVSKCQAESFQNSNLPFLSESRSRISLKKYSKINFKGNEVIFELRNNIQLRFDGYLTLFF